MEDNSYIEIFTIPTIYVEIFGLMFVSFIIGYLFAFFFQKSKYQKLSSSGNKEVRKAVSVEIKNNFPDNENFEDEIEQNEERISIDMEDKIPRLESNYLDFERLGYANKVFKDDLQKIVGIGPYTEEKLNDIGIFTFSQISLFNDKDIKIVTQLIRFFPERIKNDKWTIQAKMLVERTKNRATGLNRDNDLAQFKSF